MRTRLAETTFRIAATGNAPSSRLRAGRCGISGRVADTGSFDRIRCALASLGGFRSGFGFAVRE
jgi:hypothetical protein